MRVRLIVPNHTEEPMKTYIKYPQIFGEHFAYHGAEGEVLAGVENGAWVRFNGSGYVGCPKQWLERSVKK